MDQQGACIDFTREIDSSKHEYYTVKVNTNNQQLIYRVPMFGASPFDQPEDLLNTSQSFMRMAERLHWDDATCINQFESCLDNQVVAEWQTTVNSAVAGATFDEVLFNYILCFIPEDDAFLKLQTYMSNVKKPRKMTTQAYFDRITFICMIADQLPQSNGTPLLDDQAKLLVAYNGCPYPWKQELYCMNMSLTNMTYIDLKNFMRRMETILDNNNNNSRQNNNNNQRNHNHQRNNNNNQRSNNNSRRYGNNPQNNRQQG